MFRAHLTMVTLDPVAETASAPIAVTRGTLVVTSAVTSPDGEWVAFQRAGAQEDIYLVRSDGSEYRQITDDAFRDRGPSFSPDGERLVFYSDRTGRYELWTIRTDGSDLRRLTETKHRSLWFPYYAPDGERVAARNERGTFILQISDGLVPESELERLPDVESDIVFGVDHWSPDGQRMAGRGVRNGQEYLPGIYIHDLTTGAYELFAVSNGWMLGAAWLNDSRRLVTYNGTELLLLDTSTGAVKVLTSAPGGELDALSISQDNTRVFFTTTSYEADVWMASWE